MGIFDLFKTKNTDTRKAYLKELIRVAKADGYLEESEYQFILRIAKKLECSSQDVAHLSKEVDNETDTDPGQSKEKRLRLIFDLVGIMMIDGIIDPKEMILCHTVAMKSGFEDRVIDDIVYRIQKLTEQGKSIEEASDEVYLQFRDT